MPIYLIEELKNSLTELKNQHNCGYVIIEISFKHKKNRNRNAKTTYNIKPKKTRLYHNWELNDINKIIGHWRRTYDLNEQCELEIFGSLIMQFMNCTVNLPQEFTDDIAKSENESRYGIAKYHSNVIFVFWNPDDSNLYWRRNQPYSRLKESIVEQLSEIQQFHKQYTCTDLVELNSIQKTAFV